MDDRLHPTSISKPEEVATVASVPQGDSVHARLYTEYAAGGFTPDAHFISYFNRVNALISPESQVLDFGAGRGKFLEIEKGWKLHLCSLKGRCGKFIGADVDPIVLSNQMTDENVQIDAKGNIPLPDNSIDLITSWAVFEHVANAEAAAQELARILKPGGWICAWTPNKWGYVGLGARIIPNRLHVRFLRVLGTDGRTDEDVFPTTYRMNSRRALLNLFPKNRFDHHVAIRNGPPGYHGGNIFLARLVKFYGIVMPSAGRATLHIFLRKKL